MTLSASKCSPLSCIFNSLTVKPALENHLSEEADGALAKVASNRKVENQWTTISRIHFKMLKSLNFGEPRLGKLFFIFAYPENFMCLASVVKKFEFMRPCLRDPYFGTPKFCQILSFRHNYLP